EAGRALLKINGETNFVLQACSNLLAQQTITGPSAFGLPLVGQTIELIGELGPAAKPVAPVIQSALLNGDSTVRGEAAIALRNIDAELWRATLRQMNESIPATVARLTKIVSGTDVRRVPEAMQALGVLGAQAAPAVPALIEILNSQPLELPTNPGTIVRP